MALLSKTVNYKTNAKYQKHMPNLNFIAMLRIKDEERWIERVLKSTFSLCNRVYVFDDHSTDDTVKICSQFDRLKVTVVPSPFTGLDESRDKNYLLDEVIARSPEVNWILAIDGDEELESGAADKIRKVIDLNPEAAILKFKVDYLWDKPDQVRIDGVYGRFYRASAFRIHGQDVRRLKFKSTLFGNGANLHCFNHPLGLVGTDIQTEVRIKHYGYMHHEDRMKKYVYYNGIDPNNVTEDCYRHMIEVPGAKHAPGPTQLVPWKDITVEAIIHAYNEIDVLPQTIADLQRQGVQVYVIDNWSTDGTYEWLTSHNIACERWPVKGPSKYFELGPLLTRMEEVAATVRKADWFLHVDADELLRTSIEGESLVDGIIRANRAGANIIPFEIIEYVPHKDGWNGEPLEEFFTKTHVALAQKFPFHRAWKSNVGNVDIHTWAGHTIIFDTEQKLFDEKFILKHYPIRTQKQGERKVFGRRNEGRYSPDERKKDWHMHYDHYKIGANFIESESEEENET